MFSCSFTPNSESPHATDVLLIDDSLTDLRLLIDFLLNRKIRVSVAFDGQAGYQQAVLQQPKLILLDVHMPTLDGFGACRLLKSDPRTRAIPLIFLTSANDLAQRLTGFALGGVDYISKPFSEDEVLARIGVHWKFESPEELPKTVPVPRKGDSDTEVEGYDAVLVSAAQTTLRQALASPPSLDQLASLLGTNRRRLNQAFTNCCALSVFGWLREERLRHANYLISSTDTPLAVLSDHLGYATPAHFSKAFRERFGSTPRTFRGEMKVVRQQEAIE
jgi:DNA-binding response OmpR family regulator